MSNADEEIARRCLVTLYGTNETLSLMVGWMAGRLRELSEAMAPIIIEPGKDAPTAIPFPHVGSEEEQ